MSSYPPVYVGGFFSDAWDWLSGAAKSVGKWVTDNVPGADWAADAIDHGAGWLGDFAKTDVGFVVIQIITNNAYQPLAHLVGPQTASVVWATPGMMRGESFTEAYTEDVLKRLEGLAAFALGGGVTGAIGAYYGLNPNTSPEEAARVLTEKFTQNVTQLLSDELLVRVVQAIREKIPSLDPSAVRLYLRSTSQTPEWLADRIRPWMPTVRADEVALALNGLLKSPIYNVENEFRVSDGKPNISILESLTKPAPMLAKPDPVWGTIANLRTINAAMKRRNEAIASGTSFMVAPARGSGSTVLVAAAVLGVAWYASRRLKR